MLKAKPHPRFRRLAQGVDAFMEDAPGVSQVQNVSAASILPRRDSFPSHPSEPGADLRDPSSALAVPNPPPPRFHVIHLSDIRWQSPPLHFPSQGPVSPPRLPRYLPGRRCAAPGARRQQRLRGRHRQGMVAPASPRHRLCCSSSSGMAFLALGEAEEWHHSRGTLG